MEIQRRQGQGQDLAQWLAAFLSPGPSPGPGPNLHPASADQQGRWSLPRGNGRADRPRSAADGRDAHPYLEASCIEVGLTVPVGRVSRRRIDRVYGGPAGTLVPT